MCVDSAQKASHRNYIRSSMSTSILVRNLTSAGTLIATWLSGKDQASLDMSKNSIRINYFRNTATQTHLMKKLVVLM